MVILGTGGVARTMANEAALAGCDLTIAIRPDDLNMAAALAGELMTRIHSAHLSTCLLDRIEGNIALLDNATPVGMYPNTDACPVTDQVLANCSHVFDAVYNPLETLLLKKARANGAKALGGMSMLVWQAAVSHQIWHNAQYDAGDIEKLCLDSAKAMKNTF